MSIDRENERRLKEKFYVVYLRVEESTSNVISYSYKLIQESILLLGECKVISLSPFDITQILQILKSYKLPFEEIYDFIKKIRVCVEGDKNGKYFITVENLGKFNENIEVYDKRNGIKVTHTLPPNGKIRMRKGDYEIKTGRFNLKIS